VLLGNIDPALQLDVLRQVTAPKLVVADTMNLWIEARRPELVKTLAEVHTLMVSDEEARQLAGEHNLRRAAAKILKMGPTSVVIKRGDAGALLVYGEGVFAAPAMPLADVRDPTGAGDSFAGGFMGYLAYAGDLSPRAIRTAMIMGSVMGSFAVEQFSIDGIRDLTPARIQQRFDEMAELAHFERVRL
jgi:sugar/nucleoside kinase (ribokinase family)